MDGSFNYLIDPGIYYSGTYTFRIFSIHFLYRAFTVLYSHNQHAHVTSAELFVNIHCFKKWRSFIRLICKVMLQNKHTYPSTRQIYTYSDTTPLCWVRNTTKWLQHVDKRVQLHECTRFRNFPVPCRQTAYKLTRLPWVPVNRAFEAVTGVPLAKINSVFQFNRYIVRLYKAESNFPNEITGYRKKLTGSRRGKWRGWGGCWGISWRVIEQFVVVYMSRSCLAMCENRGRTNVLWINNSIDKVIR